MNNSLLKSENTVNLLLIFNAIILLIGYSTLNLYGLILIILGGYIYFHNRHLMGSHWSVRVEAKKKLVTAGLFKYIRHPLYLGCLIAAAGLTLLTMNWMLLIVTIFLDLPFLYFRARIEEEILSKELKGYKEYMNKTGMFLPKL